MVADKDAPKTAVAALEQLTLSMKNTPQQIDSVYLLTNCIEVAQKWEWNLFDLQRF